MAIIPIRTIGDPVLRTPAAPIAKVDRRIRSLAKDMIETMYDAPGVGLAGPQIGVSRLIACFDAQDELGPRVMINPVITETRDEWVYDEGCLSVPGHFWEVKRPGWVRVEAVDQDGEPVVYEGDGLLGRVLLHEYDHLMGKLIVDRLTPEQKQEYQQHLISSQHSPTPESG